MSGQLGGFALSLSAQVSGYNAGSQLPSNTTAAKKSMGSLRSESVSIILFLPTLSWSAGQIPRYLPILFVLRCSMLSASITRKLALDDSLGSA